MLHFWKNIGLPPPLVLRGCTGPEKCRKNNLGLKWEPYVFLSLGQINWSIYLTGKTSTFAPFWMKKMKAVCETANLLVEKKKKNSKKKSFWHSLAYVTLFTGRTFRPLFRFRMVRVFCGGLSGNDTTVVFILAMEMAKKNPFRRAFGLMFCSNFFGIQFVAKRNVCAFSELKWISQRSRRQGISQCLWNPDHHGKTRAESRKKVWGNFTTIPTSQCTRRNILAATSLVFPMYFG